MINARHVLAGLMVCAMTLLTACSPSPEEIGRRVRLSMQQTMSTDPNFAQFNLQILNVVVIKESGNKYQGMATVVTRKGTSRQVPISVTADGEQVMWKAEQGTFLFVAQEEMATMLGQ